MVRAMDACWQMESWFMMHHGHRGPTESATAGEQERCIEHPLEHAYNVFARRVGDFRYMEASYAQYRCRRIVKARRVVP